MGQKFNFKEITVKELKKYGKKVKDISWIGSKDFVIPNIIFWKLADKPYYYDCCLANDLIIFFKDNSHLLINKNFIDNEKIPLWLYFPSIKKPNKIVFRIKKLHTNTFAGKSLKDILNMEEKDDDL